MTSSSTKQSAPRRGEVWLVNLDPTKGAEMQKTRPAVVVSSDTLRALPLRLIVPITGWKDRFLNKYSHVRLSPTSTNGLSKESAADTLQVRGVAIERFDRKLGVLTASQLEEISAAIAAVVEYQ